MIIILSWFLFVIYWIYAARLSHPIPDSRHTDSVWNYLIPLIVCDLLLIIPITTITLWSFPIIGTALVFIGLAFAMWARECLGYSWSGLLTIQEDHQLITTGAYRYLRHPIYAGILLAFIGTGLFIGDLRGYIAPFFAAIAFVYKARIEEQQLINQFPEYRYYKRRTIL